MGYMPLNYEQINISRGVVHPTTIKPFNNQAYEYWQRSLIQRALSVFEWTLPDDWDGSVKDFLLFCLVRWGYVAVFDNPEFGFTFQPCTLSDFNWYYQPAFATISNPHLPGDSALILKIGEECELLKMTPDYLGIWDIISRYSEKLAGLDVSINTNIINSKIAWILGAKNKSAAHAIKSALDQINMGEPAVVLDSKLVNTSKKPNDDQEPWNLIDLDIKNNFILPDLLQSEQTILNEFDAEVGIPTIPYAKKERMVNSEANSRMQDSKSRAETWLECLKGSIDMINRHYGKDLAVELRHDEAETESEVAGNG